MRKALLSLLTTALFALTAGGQGPSGSVYFVSPQGNDAAAGTYEQPFATAARARPSASS